MPTYTLAMLGLALAMVGVLVAMRRRGAGEGQDVGARAVARAMAETAATATVPSGPMPLSPPSSDAGVPAGWAAAAPTEATTPGRPFPPPFDPSAALAWTDDDVVTAPGWPMPGELDLSWAGPAAVPPPPAIAEAGPAPAAADRAPGGPAGTPEPAPARAGMPRWEPIATTGAGGLPEPPPAPPEPAAGPEALAAEEVGEPPLAWAGTTEAEEARGFSMPSWDGAAAAAPAEAAGGAAPADGNDVEVAWLESAATAAPAEAAAGAASADGNDVEVAWLESAATAAPAEAAAGELIAWLEPSLVPPPRPPGPHGRFAVGGTARAAGDQALAAVDLREPRDSAPVAWRLAPAPDAAPGTLVLEVEGLVNCAGDAIEVVEAPGFAPGPGGFTVRATALAPGDFAAAGTYRIA